MIQRTHEKFRWQLADDFAPLLEAVLDAPPQVVKESPAKLVARHEVDGRAFYVKRYRHGAFLFRPLKFLIKRSQAEQEWRLASEFDERGVPIVRHVALGERWSARGLLESVLVTEEFTGGVPLDDSHQSFFPDVIDFVRAIARCGVAHMDLHPSNILFNPATREMRLIDLHGAGTFDDDSPANCRDVMLVQLGMTLRLPVDPEIHRLSGSRRVEAFAQRARRCLKTNRDFARVRIGGRSWQVRRSMVEAVKEALDDPNRFLSNAQILKDGRSATVGAAGGLVLKRHNFKKPLNLVKDLFRGSRARRSFLKGYHLELCGFPTPAVLATADDRLLGIPVRSFLLMQRIEGALDAGRWDGKPPQAYDKSDRSYLPWCLGFIIARLHNEGFTHRDLKETNILMDNRGLPNLIDLDGLTFVQVVTLPEAAANLRRLAEGMASAGRLTRANVFFFLRTYCRTRGVRPSALFPRGERRAKAHAHRSR